MIAWVYERAAASPALDRLLIATDSDEVLRYCARAGLSARMTSSSHASGTDRLIEVMQQDTSAGESADIYVNIQGDEPMVTAGHIQLLLSPFFARAGQSETTRDGQASLSRAVEISSSGVQVSTLKVPISREAAEDPNAVKVVTDCQGRALYFSRAAIPFDRGNSAQARYYKHLGFYAYTAQALRTFSSLPPSTLEQTEGLEQLRFLENSVPIHVLETPDDTIGVDTEPDLEQVQEYFSRTRSGDGLVVTCAAGRD
jgi:3-deoxy-manno-octulosonate cytidylyltransferase (CMP-KDO synthetase)